MITIEKPTEKQIERMMDLIAFNAEWDEESIGDSFCFTYKNGFFFDGKNAEPFIDYCKTNYPEEWEYMTEEEGMSEDDPIVIPSWFDRYGLYDFFRIFCEYAYKDEELLRNIAEELDENFINFSNEPDCKDQNLWDNSDTAFDSYDEYKRALDKFKKSIEF